MIPTTHSDVHPTGWKPAPTHEIARLGQRLRRRSSRRQFFRTAVTAASVAVTGGGVWLVWLRDCDGEQDYGGIVCSQVVRQGPDYMAGKVPEPTRSKIAEHVAKCPHCGPLFKKMEDEMSGMG